MFRLLLALLVATVGGSSAAEPPAFLDSPTQVRVALDPPLTPEAMQGQFRVWLAGREVPITRVEAGGEPERERRLPRTPGRIVLAGTFQSALGGRDWDPDGDVTQMTEVRPGVHELVVELPAGRYEYKIARDGSWNENYGQGFELRGANIPLVLTEKRVVRFIVDLGAKRILNSVENPGEVSTPPMAPPKPAVSPETKFPVAVLTLARAVPLSRLDRPILVRQKDRAERQVIPREVLSAPELVDDRPLGAIYAREATTFRVWSPIAGRATLLLYREAQGGEPRRVRMIKNDRGTWETTVTGDLHGWFYLYEFESLGETRRATDVNSRSANRDSTRSQVVDLRRTDPPGWPSQPRLRHLHQTDAVIYELHVRDFTVHADSGVDAAKRGKYAGMVQSGTRVPGTDVKTGLDYLVDLGVTDIHILPIQNFLTGSFDEYTWGYATNLFDVPEETYSQTPDDRIAVIREFKQMVMGMHRAGLRVILDVVYNHTWPPEGKDSNFWQTVPYYYFRTNDRGQVLNESGVGNALHDERPMVRKFVRDSLLFWLEEYRVDGYRFDLIGMHHPESVRDWATAMRATRPDVLLYGEPWTGGGPTRFGKGAQRGTGVAVFNDRFRGAFRGELDGSAPGFAMGGRVDLNFLRKAIVGWIDSAGTADGFTDSPQETINYISAHDNLTLVDRIARSIPNSQPELQRAALRLSGAAVLLAQGVPFLEGGAQIGRTKGGNSNSYNAGDEVNGYDWDRGLAYRDVNAYYRGLIQLRRGMNAFRLPTAEEIRRRLSFVAGTSPEVLAWTIDATGLGDRWGSVLVVLHGSTAAGRFTLPEGQWDLLVDEARAGLMPLGSVQGELALAPLSAYVLVRR